MLQKLLSANALFPIGLTLIRIVSGGLIMYYGMELFNPETMNNYTGWLTNIEVPFPRIMATIGKLCELIGGCCLALGLFTRIATILLMLTMSFITFVMLDGSLLSDPFNLFLIFACFFFIGGGTLSVDHLITKRLSK